MPWLLIFRDPERRAAGWEAGLAGRGRRGVLSASEALRVLKAPAFWGVALVGVGLIPSLYFATQWLPTTLETSLGLAYDQQLGNYLLVIYLMQDAGLWLGGALVLWLSKTRLSTLAARKAVIVMGYLFMLSILLLPYQTSAALTVAVFSLFTFGIGIFLGNQHAFQAGRRPDAGGNGVGVGGVRRDDVHGVRRAAGGRPHRGAGRLRPRLRRAGRPRHVRPRRRLRPPPPAVARDRGSGRRRRCAPMCRTGAVAG